MSWTTQLRKGALELAVMNAINGDRLYGYDIVRLLRQHEGLVMGEGTVYPILSRLKSEGFLQTTLEESPDGPARKYYEMTDAGRTHLSQMNAEWTTLVTSLEAVRQAGAR
jgi:PadR family transcriptional regulator PadR